MQVKECKEIAYGPFERNKLDVYLVGSPSDPAPALIYFHGGGYLAGDKSAIKNYGMFQECLQVGISIISCNYRFISADPFPAPMQDGTRAIQFVRSMAAEWGIDPNRIASSGQSAGGHIALWNALKGEQAQPDSPDPVARQSSAVAAFIGYATQASKDQRFYEGIYDGPHIQPNLKLFYGLSSIDELYHPDVLRLAEEASAIHHMSPAAPPALMTYEYPLDPVHPHIPADAPVGEVIHHPMHGYVLGQKYKQLGIPYVLRHSGDPLRPGEVVRFLQESFKRVSS